VCVRHPAGVKDQAFALMTSSLVTGEGTRFTFIAATSLLLVTPAEVWHARQRPGSAATADTLGGHDLPHSPYYRGVAAVKSQQ
jgi:hypothetical protein